MNTTEEQIVNLYVGYMDRAPDRDGLNFWVSQANAGADILGIAYSFSQTPEYLAIYGGLGNQALLNKIYDNLFNRAPDAEGNAYWLAQLDSGASSARLIVDVISGAQGQDRLTLQNTAIVAKDWTDHSPAEFVLADAQNAIQSIGEAQGNGVTIDFADALLPYQSQLAAAMNAAWAQWGNHGRLDVKLDFFDTGNNVLAFATPRNELFTGQVDRYGTPLTQSNVGLEVNTGKDMNGDLPDMSLTIAMSLDRFFQYDPVSILAHEIGHALGFRTEAFDFDQDYSAQTTWDQWITIPNGTTGQAFFNGPEAMEVYGGPVPVIGYYNATHLDVYGSLMWTSFGQNEVKTVGALEIAIMHDVGVFV